MSYQYIKRIPVQQQSADVKNVPCGTAILPGLVYGEALIGKQFEKITLIKQRYVDAAFVGRLCHHIPVVCFAQGRVAGKVAHHTVILHLTQGNKGGRRPSSGGDDDAGYIIQFLSVFRVVPMPGGIRQELVIIL